MIRDRVLYSLKDINIIPTPITTITSRSECICRGSSIEGKGLDYLPLIAAPMSCVLYGSNYLEFSSAGVNTVIPRTYPFEERLKLFRSRFCAFSLKEAEEICKIYSFIDAGYICLDMANGHMLDQLEAGKNLKNCFGDHIKLMGGNIANPDTYVEYKRYGFDYVRCGIGGGNGCFVEGTMILMADGSKKPIDKVEIGDTVLNGAGIPDTVINVVCLNTTETIKINNSIECTPNHEFYVVLKEDANKITDSNLSEFAFWIKAEDLDKNKHLLIKIDDV